VLGQGLVLGGVGGEFKSADMDDGKKGSSLQPPLQVVGLGEDQVAVFKFSR
jgi:hypothetical protein